MKTYKRLALAALVLVLPMMVLAQSSTTTSTTTAATVANLLQQISVLQAKIAELRAQQQQLIQTSGILDLIRDLREGSQGDDVKQLQNYLAIEGAYPEKLITGFFGPLTKNAVARFQKLHGLDPVGVVGPLTRDLIKSLKKVGKNATTTITLITGVTGSMSTTTTTGTETNTVTICHIPPGNPTAKKTITISQSALKAHQKHGDFVGQCGASTATTTPPVDTTAPTISDISESGIASTTATIAWKTNESASGKIYYGTSTPFALSGASTKSESGLGTSHSLTLTDLVASTTYSYVIESKDAAGNTATSSVLDLLTTL